MGGFQLEMAFLVRSRDRAAHEEGTAQKGRNAAVLLEQIAIDMIGDMALTVVAERVKHASDLRRFGEHKLLLAACLLRLTLDKKRALQQRLQATDNESKRKAVLADWQNWGIWHKAPEIGLSVYRLDLPDGSFFTASWYEGDDFFPGGGTHNVNRPRFNLCDKGGKLKAGSKAESLLTDKLKELRKELLERESNGHA